MTMIHHHAQHTLGLAQTIGAIACIMLAVFGLGVLFLIWRER